MSNADERSIIVLLSLVGSLGVVIRVRVRVRVRRRIRGSSEQGRQDRLVRVKDCH